MSDAPTVQSGTLSVQNMTLEQWRRARADNRRFLFSRELRLASSDDDYCPRCKRPRDDCTCD